MRSATTQSYEMTALLRSITAVEVVVLVAAGVGLFLLPDRAHDGWPWPPTPFNTRFLGAIYLASLASVALMLFIRPARSPARVVLPALLAFTAIVLAVSVAYSDRLEFDRWATWLWFALYIILPVNAAYHLKRFPARLPTDAAFTPPMVRTAMLVIAGVAGAYGVGLLLAPKQLSEFWPWPIDAFHGRMYSTAFIAGAVELYLVSRRASTAESATVGMTLSVFGLFAIIGLLVVDRSADAVDWSAAGSWIWVGAAAMAAMAGIGLLILSPRFRAIRPAAFDQPKPEPEAA